MRRLLQVILCHVGNFLFNLQYYWSWPIRAIMIGVCRLEQVVCEHDYKIDGGIAVCKHCDQTRLVKESS